MKLCPRRRNALEIFANYNEMNKAFPSLRLLCGRPRFGEVAAATVPVKDDLALVRAIVDTAGRAATVGQNCF